MDIFIKNLKTLIAQSEKAQVDICKGMNISKQKLSNWKSGYTEPNLNDLITIATYFQCSVNYLLGIEDDFGNIVIKKETPQLSAEELKIIEDFRELNPSGKKLVKQTIETLRTSISGSRQNKFS